MTTPMPGWGWVLQYRTIQAMKTLSSMEEGDLGGLPRPTVSLPNSRSRRLRLGKNCQCFLWENARLSSETFPHPRERQANTRPSENRARLGSGTLSKLWVPGAETTNQQHDMFKTAQHIPSLTEMLGGWGGEGALLKTKAPSLGRCSSDLIWFWGKRVCSDANEMPGSRKTHSRI